MFVALMVAALSAVSAFAASDTWSGSVNSTWDISTLNWNSGASAFTSGDDALFTGTPANNVTAATGLTIGAITLDNTFTGSVALTGANTVNGATAISAGTLTLTNSATAAGSSAITVNGSGTLAVNASTAADVTYANTVAGAGKVQFRYLSSGGHDIFLNNLGSFTGTIQLSLAPGSASTAGKARLGGATLSGTSSLIIDSGTQLYMGSGNVTLAGIQVQGTGNTETRGAIRFQTGTLTSPISLMGDTTFGTEGATLPSGSPISAGSSGLKTLTLGGTSDLSGGSLTINGIISDGSGQVALNQKNTGTLTLSGANTYSGGTTIGAGTASVSGSSPFGSGPVTLSGATLASATVVTVTNTITVGGNHTFNSAGGNLTLSGGISGTCGNVNISGANSVILGGSNNFVTTSANFVGPNITGSSLVVTNTTTFTGAGFTDFRGYLTVAGNASVTILSGGSLAIITSSGSGLNSIVGNNAAGTSTLTANGGSFSINGNSGFALGNNINTAIGVLTITNGGIATIAAGSTTLHDVRNMIAMGRDNATGIINLAPGTLATGRQFVRDGNSGGTAGAGTATFNFNGGTLKAQADQTAGNGWFETATSGNFQVVTTTIMDGGAIIDANGFNVNINTVLAHGGVSSTDGGLTLTNSTGTGTLKLTGVNTYNGATTVNAGTLEVGTSGTGIASGSATTVNSTGTLLVDSGATVASSSVTVAAGGTLKGSGTCSGSVTLSGASSAINLQTGAANTLTLSGGLNLNSGNVLTFDVATAGSDQIAVTGSVGLPASGTVTVNLNKIGAVTAGSIKLISASSGTMDYTKFNLATAAPAGFSWQLANDADGHSLDLVITANAPTTAYWKGGVDNNWSTADTGSFNWASDSAGTTSTGAKPGIPTAVIFSATGAGNLSTTLGGNFEIASLTFNSASGNVMVGGANTLQNDGNLTLDSGAGSVTVSANSYVMGTDQAFANNSSSALSISSPISGAHTLTVNSSGSGTTTLSGANSHSGTIVSAGTLALSGSGTLGASTAAVTAAGGTLDLGTTSQNSGTVTVSGGTITNGTLTATNLALQSGTVSAVLAGTSIPVAKTTAGAVTLSGVNTYSGTTTVSAGTLNLNNAAALGTSTLAISGGTLDNTSGATVTLNNNPQSWNGDFTFAGTTNLNLGTGAVTPNASRTVTVSANNLTVGGSIGGGAVGLTKAGNGTLTLSAATNTFTGQLQVSGGTLLWNTAAALASSGNFQPLLIGTGGSLIVNGSLKYSSGSAGVNGYLQIGAPGVGNIGTITINSGGLLTFTNQTGNPGSVVGQQGTGGTSTLNINGGTFNWDGSGALAVGNAGGSGLLLITNGGTATILKGTGSAEEAYLAIGRNSLTSTGTLYLATGTLATDRIIARGVATPIGVGYVCFDGGTLKALANQSDWLQAAVSGNANPPNAVTIADSGATIDANGFSVAINNNLLHGGVAATDGGLTLANSSGTGTLTLGGANTYTGNTTVSAGTLALSGSGSLATPKIILASGTTFDVSGLTSTFALGSGQTLTNISGTGNLAGNVNLASGALALSYTNGTPSLNVTNGTLAFNGNAVTVNVAGTLPHGIYKLISTNSGGLVSGTLPSSVTVNGIGTATASLSIFNGELYLTVNHPPVAGNVSCVRNAGINTLRITISDLLTNVTDADGDTITLVGTGTSTNGIVVTTSGTNYLYYYNTNSVNDQFSYTVTDGFGGTNSGLVSIVVSNVVTGQITGQLTSFAGGVANLTFHGIPNYSYVTERSTNLTDWVDVQTNNASTNGVLNVTDQFNDLGGVPPSSAYYRLKWQP